MEKRNQTVIVCVAIGAIALVEFALISAGYNGTLATIAVAAIAGLAGYVMPQPKLLK